MNNKISLICETEEMRLDQFVSSELEDLSRNYIQKLIGEGHVSVNGTVNTVKKFLVKIDDEVEVQIPDPQVLEITAENIPLEIIYEDDDVIIVNKPQGMVVHPAPGNYTGTLVNALMYISERLSTINGVIRPGIVHRIDKDTSGLLMVAKNDKSHEWLAHQLKEKTTIRKYIAIVNGTISKESGTVDAPLGRHPQDRKKMAIISTGRNAVTHFEVIERYKYHTFVRLRLETGRTHQIRVHMASIGHPILGDPIYGQKNERVKHDGQALHAKKIGFVHPTTMELMTFDSDIPFYFQELLRKCQGLK
ncbi:RluA family pseudouridine synthase [Fusibacter bizertensis]|uniref:Pseudouridine synthase n=1 Tax=Fusibacter bizertensis TaxID=1488331 RepID=A0ABT6N8F0_9FIRM|nr:RluA family pseudouridine synthase [Fusibacter bizertensis]MDH8676691.1 RluA family pseudouridine synthase [Fusibacter bizertensis]